MDLIEFGGEFYPKFQSEGYAMQFAIPFISKVCKGIGVDVGCNRIEWSYEGSLYKHGMSYKDWEKLEYKNAKSFPIDPVINGFTALIFPNECKELDYVVSSHCLEHLENWVDVLDYWHSKLKIGGILFLYLPDYSQLYWRPWNNRKHKNIFSSEIIYDYMKSKGYKNIFRSGTDLNNSFMIFGQKC